MKTIIQQTRLMVILSALVLMLGCSTTDTYSYSSNYEKIQLLEKAQKAILDLNWTITQINKKVGYINFSSQEKLTTFEGVFRTINKKYTVTIHAESEIGVTTSRKTKKLAERLRSRIQ